ncbi:hypothetical protein ACTFIV_006167 [Dictyostelium citrinum]
MSYSNNNNNNNKGISTDLSEGKRAKLLFADYKSLEETVESCHSIEEICSIKSINESKAITFTTDVHLNWFLVGNKGIMIFVMRYGSFNYSTQSAQGLVPTQGKVGGESFELDTTK